MEPERQAVPDDRALSKQSTWVVIPAYNEQTVIADVVASVAQTGYQVVVVDDCSKDNTFEVLAGSNAHRLRHPINLGQGAALQTGIQYALRKGAQFVVTFDADGQHQAEEIEPMLKTLTSSGSDIVLGSRFLPGQARIEMPASRRLLLKCATFYTRITTGLRLTDTHNGFRVMTRATAEALNITQNRMAHASQVLSEIAEHKLKYVEFPVTIRYTAYSLAKGQRASNAFNILWESLLGKLFQ